MFLDNMWIFVDTTVKVCSSKQYLDICLDNFPICMHCNILNLDQIFETRMNNWFRTTVLFRFFFYFRYAYTYGHQRTDYNRWETSTSKYEVNWIANIKAPLRQSIANPTSTVIHPVFLPLRAPTTHSQPICAMFNIHADEGEVWIEANGRQRYWHSTIFSIRKT